jgi:hypothetical protein
MSAAVDSPPPSCSIETVPVSAFFPRGEWPPAPSPVAVRAVLRAFSPGGAGILFISDTGALPATATACISCARAAVLRAALAWCELDAPARARVFATEKLGSDAPRAGTLAVRWDGADDGGAWPEARALAAAAAAVAEESPHAGTSCCSACGGSGGAMLSRGDESAVGGGDDGGGAPSLNALVSALGCALSVVCAGVAAAADDALQHPARNLFRALVGAGTAKARAVSYPAGASGSDWQPWHYDYGIFSALLSPAVAADGGATLLDAGAFARACPGAGLVVRGLCGGADAVAHIPAGCIGVQVGESAQILSGGRLVATPHCVRAPAGADGDALSRAAFVVFCQPPWGAQLTAVGDGALARGRVLAASQRAAEGLGGCVPLLDERWADGDTFSSFSRATTAAYFGARGVQRGKTL